jgi:hypothetical protein
MLYTIKVYLLLIWRTSSYISYIKKKKMNLFSFKRTLKVFNRLSLTVMYTIYIHDSFAEHSH